MAEQKSTEAIIGIINAEAAKLAGVADTLREITAISGDAQNIVGMLSDVVDGVNETISNAAMELASHG